MLPVLLAGYPHRISAAIHSAMFLEKTGTLLLIGESLLVELIWAFHSLIGWQNMIGWILLDACIMAVALIPLWWGTFRLLGVRIAWVTTVLLSFMPLYWSEVVYMGESPIALLFLFFGIASFIEFYKRKRIVAIILGGLFFGLTLASSHAFIALLPWFLVVYLWQHRSRCKRAVIDTALYCGFAYIAFVLPLFPNALQSDMTLVQRIAIFLPSVESHYTGVMHLYPDLYTYEFLKEEFEQNLLQKNEQASFLARQFDRNYRINFGVENVGFFGNFFNGGWLFITNLPNMFMQEKIGGMFLWLFILPGIVVLYRNKRRLLLQIAGLWLSMEIVIRFVLHFARDHLMDVGWALTLIAAVGVVAIADVIQKHTKKFSATTLSIVIVAIISVQMVQANRMLFARLYAKSDVPDTYAAQVALEQIPDDAVIAYPKGSYGLFALVQREPIMIHNDTIDYLSGLGRLQEPLEYYGITHIIGYTNDRAEKILSASPDVQVISYDSESMNVKVTPFIELLLHTIR